MIDATDERHRRRPSSLAGGADPFEKPGREVGGLRHAADVPAPRSTPMMGAVRGPWTSATPPDVGDAGGGRGRWVTPRLFLHAVR
jgi:hypothetical protein